MRHPAATIFSKHRRALLMTRHLNLHFPEWLFIIARPPPLCWGKSMYFFFLLYEARLLTQDMWGCPVSANKASVCEHPHCQPGSSSGWYDAFNGRPILYTVLCSVGAVHRTQLWIIWRALCKHPFNGISMTSARGYSRLSEIYKFIPNCQTNAAIYPGYGDGGL